MPQGQSTRFPFTLDRENAAAFYFIVWFDQLFIIKCLCFESIGKSDRRTKSETWYKIPSTNPIRYYRFSWWKNVYWWIWQECSIKYSDIILLFEIRPVSFACNQMQSLARALKDVLFHHQKGHSQLLLIFLLKVLTQSPK